MIFLGFGFGVWLGNIRARKAGLPPGAVMDLTVWIMISSLLGARLAYVISHINDFKGRWVDAISPFQSDGSIGIAGLVVLGGVALAIPVAWYYLKRKNIPFLKMMDVLVPSLAFGIAFGRVGCFLNGCCFGLPTELPWGMIFPATCFAGDVYPNQYIHPTQIYSLLYNVIIGVVLLLYTKRRKFEGELFFGFMVLYGAARFLVEIIRHYGPEMMTQIGGIRITSSMIGSAALFIVGVIFLIRGYRKIRREVEAG